MENFFLANSVLIEELRSLFYLLSFYKMPSIPPHSLNTTIITGESVFKNYKIVLRITVWYTFYVVIVILEYISISHILRIPVAVRYNYLSCQLHLITLILSSKNF